MGAHQRQRKLAGEQFVIGEPRPGRALGLYVGGLGRTMQGPQRIGEGGECSTPQPGVVLPFRQLRDFAERAVAALRTWLRLRPSVSG